MIEGAEDSGAPWFSDKAALQDGRDARLREDKPTLGPDYVNDTIWFSPADLEKPGLSDLVDYLEKNTIKSARLMVAKLEPRSIIYTLEAFKALYDMPDDAEVSIERAHRTLPGYTITAQWGI